jgi:hypothetical protein
MNKKVEKKNRNQRKEKVQKVKRTKVRVFTEATQKFTGTRTKETKNIMRK